MAMKTAEEFTNDFMRKLNNDEFKKDNQPNTGNAVTPEYVNMQVAAYQRLLKSGILEEAVRF